MLYRWTMIAISEEPSRISRRHKRFLRKLSSDTHATETFSPLIHKLFRIFGILKAFFAEGEASVSKRNELISWYDFRLPHILPQLIRMYFYSFRELFVNNVEFIDDEDIIHYLNVIYDYSDIVSRIIISYYCTQALEYCNW